MTSTIVEQSFEVKLGSGLAFPGSSSCFLFYKAFVV